MNYFDLHCDTVFRMYTENKTFDDENLIVNSRFSGIFEKWYQCFAVFIKDNTAEPFLFYEQSVKCYKDKILKFENKHFKPILTVENGALIENDINRLSKLKQDNVFSLTLTWNGENNIAGGANSDVGLKLFGKDVIKELNNLKIATDLSHLNKKSFYKAVEIAKYPIATHSCFNEVFKHKRNIDIDMAKLIAEKNGIIGICLYDEFLGTEDVFEGFYRNVCVCLENGLQNNISVGSDFDGCETKINLAQIPLLYNYLLNKGIDTITLDKLFFYNAYNYINDIV